MKKKIFIIGLFTITAMTIQAQLKVCNTGQTYMGEYTPISPNTAATLSLGYNDGYNYGSYSYGISSHSRNNKSFIVGVRGLASNANNSYRTFGVQGLAGGGTNGWNFGVLGALAYPTGNGAGIYGSTTSLTGTYVNGRYAGYFNGQVYVDNSITATSFITPSDMRLKENVQVVKDITNEGGTLENLLSMNIIKYNYKKPILSSDITDTLSTSMNHEENLNMVTHYGLSAQELQKIYPDLVYEGQDGYLGVNYVELVPILIRSIQELKAELDKVKCSEGSMKKGAQTNVITSNITNQACLYQNTPNPFTERTEIRFELPDNVQNAYIYIFNMSGKMLRQIPVNASMRSITINGFELPAGIYLYSLAVNGQEIDTKRMILSK